MDPQFKELACDIVEGVVSALQSSKQRPVAPGWLSPAQAAQYIGSTESTLTAWRKQGRGPCFTRRGNAVRYRISDLDAFMEAAYVGRD